MGDNISQLEIDTAQSGDTLSARASSGEVTFSESWWNEIFEKAGAHSKQVVRENAELRKQVVDISLILAKKELAITSLQQEMEEMRRQLTDLCTGTADKSANRTPPTEDTLDAEPMEIYRKHFNGDATTAWVRDLWVFAVELMREFASDGAPKQKAWHTLAPVYAFYKVISDKTADRRFVGTMAEFADCWNQNVVKRLPVAVRTRYTCLAQTLRAGVARSPWRDTTPDQWRRLSLECEMRDGQYAMAATVKGRYDRFEVDHKQP